ncbi:hypothetical protein [Alkaliphilus hydrothermalis]|uniref:Uncharacterized protein n=1 Tax=Alkaliphilus hydrothermalis TaxID=1482730 RepID=A0ABS2NP86_9FIRM|nr:hypothetical protein [Alkaliphilus hydrothermalis]MBM7614758.1 hypothetical protein [Alkaliphilus hydrothermalis]
MKRRYRRYFIIMENEDNGFEVSNNQKPKGHAKVEVSNDKGKMVLHCQNLKDLSEKRMRYRWYLVNTNKEEPTVIDIGPMEVDENGKGEITWEFNGENVKATKEAIDDFNLLTMLVESIGDNKTIVAPLVGYIDKEKFDWREILAQRFFGDTTSNSFSKKPKLEKSQPIPKPIPDIIPKKEQNPPSNLQPKVEKPVREENKPKEENKIVEKPMIKEETIVKEKTTVKETPIVKETQQVRDPQTVNETSKPVQENQPFIRPQAAKEPKHQRAMENPYGAQSVLKSLQGYIETTVKMFPKVNPFEEPIENYQWWHIYYNQQTMYRAHMPFIGYIDGAKYPTQYYPYQYPTDCQRQVYQYQHYLFGIVYDANKEVKYYVYGIPGRKTKSEQPYGGKTGFDYWKSCRRGHVDDRTQGYWLLHIDPTTGGVAKPFKSTTI